MTTMIDNLTVDRALSSVLEVTPLAGHVIKAMHFRYTPYFEVMEQANGIALTNLFYNRMHTPLDANNCNCSNRTRATNMNWHRPYYRLMHQAIPVCNRMVWDQLVNSGFRDPLVRHAQNGMEDMDESGVWNAHRRVLSFASRSAEHWFASPDQDGYVVHPGEK
ncbi:MAG: hypothetical protein JWO07_689 [Candidatus Saccharibacteria bacterium]|nr:hypothetical protein [Candidatus Saccharibacteria bacterium]